MPPRRAYALIVEKGRALIVRNRTGTWTLPGGRAKSGERLRHAAMRETREETGLVIRLGDRLRGRYLRGDDEVAVVFAARKVKGKPKPRSEIVDLKWVKLSRLPDKLPSFRTKRLHKALQELAGNR